MNISYDAYVIAVDDIIEEEVVLLVEGNKIRAFASFCPEKIEIGKKYKAEFNLVIPDSELIEITLETVPRIEMLGQGLACTVYGYLSNATIRSIVDFPDQDIHYDYPDCNDNYIKIDVERVDVSLE